MYSEIDLQDFRIFLRFNLIKINWHRHCELIKFGKESGMKLETKFEVGHLKL